MKKRYNQFIDAGMSIKECNVGMHRDVDEGGSFMDAVLLAAGNSVRFGANKLLYDLEGKKMYRHILEPLYRMKQTGRFGQIVVVSQYEEIFADIESSFPEIKTVSNPEPERGISGSIRLALEKLMEVSPDSEGCLFTVADQPCLTAESLEKLTRTWEKYPEGIVAACHGGWVGNPVVFHKKYYEELKALAGDVGGKKVLRMHEEDVRLCEIPRRELLDMDTPEAVRGIDATIGEAGR